MLQKFWLLEGDRFEKQWRRVLEPQDAETTDYEEINKKRERAIVQEYIEKGRNVHEYGILYNIQPMYKKYLEKGEIVLLNKNGGYCFYHESLNIIEERMDTDFPRLDTERGMTGFLLPDGTFHSCEYGEHRQHAHLFEGQDVIVLSSSPNGKTSTVFTDKYTYTKEQEQWLKEHIHLLDEEQVEMVEDMLKRIMKQKTSL